MILKCVLKKEGLRIDWIQLAQDRVHWQPVINMVMELKDL
jgi:hypothetical protein